MKCESTANHSPFSTMFSLRVMTGICIALFLILGWSGPLYAQMFSVGDDRPQFNTPQNEIYAGVESIAVTFEGNNPSAPGRGIFAFDGPVIRLGYNSNTVDFSLGTAGSITGIENITYFDIGGDIDFGINLYRSQRFRIQVPIRIATRFTNITNDQVFQTTTQNRFRFGSLTAGAGARISARLKEKFRIRAGAVPSYGFSFASGGFFGGSLGSVAAFGRIYFDRLFGDVGLSAGYKYDLRNYDVDENIFDYKMVGHSFELGITF